jgi:hypothetical protein
VVPDTGDRDAGRRIGRADFQDQTAYLTPKGAIAVYVGGEERLYVYKTYDDFAADEEYPRAMVAEVARSLGRSYYRELDI